MRQAGIYLDDKCMALVCRMGEWRNKCFKTVPGMSLLFMFVVVGTVCVTKLETAAYMEETVYAEEAAYTDETVYAEEAVYADETAYAGDTVYLQESVREENSTNIQLYAQSAVLMDADSGRVLFGKNEKEQMPMASTTKIMTCIVALENGNPEDVVTVSAYAAGQPKVHLGMYNGEQFKLEDLLYSLMLESHNDSAVAIAEHVGGSVEGFAELMNRKAQDIGCFDTVFITPNGLDAQMTDENGKTKVHSTTARDLARIMKYCIGESEKREEFLKITRTQSYSFTDAEGKRNYSCNNHNAFLTMMEGALSGKTGFTNNAGYCYVGALKREEKTFIVALLACGWPNNKSYKWSDTKKLMSYGLDNYEYADVYEPAEFEPILVEKGIPENNKPYDNAYVTVEIDENCEHHLRVLLKDGEKIEKKISLPGKTTAPVEAGCTMGYVKYYLNGELLKEYPVITKAYVEELDFRWIVKYIWRLYSL